MKSIRVTFMLSSVLLILGLAAAGPAAAGQDVRTIDKTNWQDVADMLPNSVIEWLKAGDFTFKMGEIDYEPGGYYPQAALDSLSANAGKYTLNEQSVIVDAQTGGDPGFISGFPFPEIDLDDPQAAAKIMYNGYYVRDVQGGLLSKESHMHFVNRDARERYVGMLFSVLPMDGYEGSRALANPKNLENMVNIVVLSPYDMAGTAMMTWRYRDNTPDMLYGYIPAIRRVRRMTPAGRSDAMFGSDFSRDDGGYPLYDGKISEFDFKLIGKKKMLVAYPGTKPIPMARTDAGEMRVDVGNRKMTNWAWENGNQAVAAWFNTDEIWTPRDVYVIEAQSKDPYYNYGKQVIYIDAKSFTGQWKEIWDRSGAYWKTGRNVWSGAQNADGSYKTMVAFYQWFLDERNQHCTIIDYTVEGFKWITRADIPEESFSLSGFTKIGK